MLRQLFAACWAAVKPVFAPIPRYKVMVIHPNYLPAKLNPIAEMRGNVTWLLDYLMLIASFRLAPALLELAKDVTRAEAEIKPNLSLLDLVLRFEQHTELLNFANALRRAALPGKYGRYFGA